MSTMPPLRLFSASSRPSLAMPPNSLFDMSSNGIVYAGISLLLALASLGLSVGMEKIMLVAFLPALVMGIYARSLLGAMGGLVFGFGIGLALPITRPASVAEGLAWFSAALVSAAA